MLPLLEFFENNNNNNKSNKKTLSMYFGHGMT
jgi:hypothetical protein